MKIGFLHTADLDDGSAGVFGSFERLFEDLLGASGIDFVPYAAHSGERPDRLESCAGYLIPGAVGSANDSEPWVDALMALVRSLRRLDIPVVGVCYGHQLLGRAFGGTVAPAAVWEVGMSDVTWIDSPDLPEPVASFVRGQRLPTRIYQVHGEEVSVLPQGAVRLAGNEACRNQAFLLNGAVLGIQGHPEFTSDVARYFLERNDVGLSHEQKRIALESLRGSNDHRLMGTLIRDFFAGNSA